MIPHDLYQDIERQLMPLIRRKAARLRGHMDLDDAIQEARVHLFKALHGYEFNRNPDLERFVGVCLNNAFAGLYNKATAQRRMPRHPVLQEDGTFKRVPRPPGSLTRDSGVVIDVETHHEDIGPEVACLRAEAAGVACGLMDQVMLRLNDREQAVMLCFAHPPREVPCSPADPGFNIAAAEYLGLTKNQLDWSLHRIRQVMLDVARGEEFKDHLGPTVNGPGWPHLAHSEAWNDKCLIESTISERGLDRTVKDEVQQSVPGAERWSKVYDWGETLCLRLGETAATLVMVGRFNRLSGTLFGSRFGSQNIPVPWYQRCMKMINGTTAQL